MTKETTTEIHGLYQIIEFLKAPAKNFDEAIAKIAIWGVIFMIATPVSLLMSAIIG